MANNSLYTNATGINYNGILNDIVNRVGSHLSDLDTAVKAGYEVHLNYTAEGRIAFVTHNGYLVPFIFSPTGTPVGETGVIHYIILQRFVDIEKYLKDPAKEPDRKKYSPTDFEKELNVELIDCCKNYSVFLSEQIRMNIAIKTFERYSFEKYHNMTVDMDGSMGVTNNPFNIDDMNLDTEVEKNKVLLDRLFQKFGHRPFDDDMDGIYSNIGKEELRKFLKKNGEIYSPYGSKYYSSAASGGYYNYVAELKGIANTIPFGNNAINNMNHQKLDLRYFDDSINKEYANENMPSLSKMRVDDIERYYIENDNYKNYFDQYYNSLIA